jgi:IS605 OrfB family transposase
MKLIRTVKIFLQNAQPLLLPTATAYTNAYNVVCQDGYSAGITNTYELHKRNYQKLRETLPSQLAISVRAKASESLKAVATNRKKSKKSSCPKSKLTSIRYDCNSYSLWLDRNEVSLLTIDGRKRFAFTLPEYYKQYTSWRHTSAELKIYGGKVCLNVVFEKEITDIEPNGTIIGIDRGENNLAVLSNGKFFRGKKVRHLARKLRKLKAALQTKGTKSAKRHLRKVRMKERRFRADINHCIAKQIVEMLRTGDTIVLEKLTGINSGVGKRSRKKNRADRVSWSFYQLEQFLLYKAAAKGIKIEYVDARYTSQCCNKCCNIRKANRKGSAFRCKNCGYVCNADMNASINIKNKFCYTQACRGNVNSPIVSVEKPDTSLFL